MRFSGPQAQSALPLPWPDGTGFSAADALAFTHAKHTHTQTHTQNQLFKGRSEGDDGRIFLLSPTQTSTLQASGGDAGRQRTHAGGVLSWSRFCKNRNISVSRVLCNGDTLGATKSGRGGEARGRAGHETTPFRRFPFL